MATTPAPSPEGGGGEHKLKFVSEPFEPELNSGSIEAMSRGEVGVPRAFVWRKQRYEVASVESAWRTHGEDRGDVYVRRHWFDVVTTTGRRLRIYFDRNPTRAGGRRKDRWWVFSADPDTDP